MLIFRPLFGARTISVSLCGHLQWVGDNHGYSGSITVARMLLLCGAYGWRPGRRKSRPTVRSRY